MYGVAIPTIDGVLNVLKEVCDGDGERGGTSCCCCWHNMREEPVLYINGKPFVLREMEHPFANVEYTGITSSRVEDMEQRMKRDVLLEVGRFGGIMVCEETEEGDLVNSWEAVEPGDVQVSEVEGLAAPVQDFPPIPSSTRKPLSLASLRRSVLANARAHASTSHSLLLQRESNTENERTRCQSRGRSTKTSGLGYDVRH